MSSAELVDELISGGYLKTPALIEAFKAVDRVAFVPAEFKSEAYENRPLPIGFNQTISQPLTVAFILELLQPQPGSKILDVGAGSGWQSALLAHLVGETGKVVAVERIPELKAFAESNLKNFPELASHINFILGDGSQGYEPEAPYNRIIAAAAGDAIPEAWKNQLKTGGTIVAPVGQSIVVVHKLTPEKFERREYFGFSFVPLIKES
ncbi:MAG: protein-L-isoaspartate O-methyltransferase [Candidatus Colwellbacteria bacterium CG_4_9_14_0_2_um_filter_50_12]|uniref:Protein-L-isoaspartate O-methyltransferase n=1 Tax=Candidatus Colwellbacteria bacterium CG_4_9_14_0_2_um_filter_50_12 TaxID=1974538 RepID=A0A2M8G1K7_9BACT|nr:MAG: protein-L-isoaspartate O-methyltransferase [Candidatus Colwellbacteria bacterium CG_4_9_14_0_2_um_filter_50_12]